MVTPPAEGVALEVLGCKGVGPTGVSAARALNLTTQLPAAPELTTWRPVPTAVHGLRVHKRSNVARRELPNPLASPFGFRSRPSAPNVRPDISMCG